MSIIQLDNIMTADPARARLPHDPKYDGGAAYLNGQICPLAEATIPLLDAGFIHSDVTYEKATVAKGNYFRLDDHFARFARSCEKFRLTNPRSTREMREIFDTLLGLTGLQNAGVFWALTRGLPKPGASLASDRNDPDAFDSRFYVLVDTYGSITTQEQRERGLDVMISTTIIRIPAEAVDPTAKNFHWMDMKLSLFEARDHHKEWSVLTDRDGYLTEAPGANIFVVKGGELYTPDSGCLEGITRAAALDLADMIGVTAHVERVHAEQLRDADEAFITSSAGGIMPINSVDGIVLGGVAGPGELSTRLHNLYWEKVWDGWLATPVDYGSAARP